MQDGPELGQGPRLRFTDQLGHDEEAVKTPWGAGRKVYRRYEVPFEA